MIIFKRIDKTIRTSEEWYPTIDGTVRVSFIRLTSNEWRVCVWGGDDFGLECDFPRNQYHQAKQLFDKLVDFTTQTKMRSWHMVNA